MGDIVFAQHQNCDFRLPGRILKIKRSSKRRGLELAKVYFYHSDETGYCNINNLMKQDEGLMEYVALATRMDE